MPVENIECQIAKGQMSRYLAGDSLSPEMAVELRAHIAECPGCAETLQKKREILQTMLSGSGGRIAIEAPASQASPTAPRDSSDEPSSTPPMNRISAMLLERLAKTQAAPHAVARLEDRPRAAQYWKPLIYSGALALVMLGMSFIMRDPTRLFGSRLADDPATPGAATSAAASNPAGSMRPSVKSTEPSAAPGSSPKGDTKPTSSTSAKATKAVTSGTEASRAPQMGTPQTKPGSKPELKPTSSASPAKRTAKAGSRSARRKQAAKPTPSGIRLYDPDGNPIQ
ncbi:MAG: zf-HC2 domain-containing protein [Armatimonadetes bacterium]|nr:zf-HC2 domain-containing protein [Armatimonadota bacterium]